MISGDNSKYNTLLSPIKKNIKTIKSNNDLFQNQNKNNNNHLLSRKDTMYLSCINEKDYPVRKFKQITTKRDWSLNLYNLDITGSSPKKYGLLNKKIDFTNNNRDIEKSYPPKLFEKLIPNYSLSNKDIEGSTPHHLKAKIVRCTNPLNPKYNLPKPQIYEEEKNEVKLKFIKDSLKIDDIKGTKPKKYGNIFLGDNLNKVDIKGISSKKIYIRKDKFDNINYNDIQKIKNKRKIDLNPLNPIYNWNYSINNVKYLVGPIDKNYSKPISVFRYKNPFNLKNDDIEGSKPDSKNKYKIFKGSNSCLNIGDIHGAIHDSLLRGIKTKRNINPLVPNYRYLGEEELKSQNNPIISDNKINKDTNTIAQTTSFNLFNSEKLPQITINDELIKNKNNNDIISLNTSEKNPNNNKPQSETNIDNKIKQMTLNLNENTSKENEQNFDKNLYKKPEIYYPLKHDKNFIFTKEGNNGSHNPYKNSRAFQRINDTKLKLLEFKNNTLNINKAKKSYESQMNDFLVNLSKDFDNKEKTIRNNINAFYEIDFPEELKGEKPSLQYF